MSLEKKSFGKSGEESDSDQDWLYKTDVQTDPVLSPLRRTHTHTKGKACVITGCLRMEVSTAVLAKIHG